MADSAVMAARALPVHQADGRVRDVSLASVGMLRREVDSGSARTLVPRIYVYDRTGVLVGTLYTGAPLFRRVLELAASMRLPATAEVMDELCQHPRALPGGTSDVVSFA